jgi:hypothetical protein
VIAFVVPVHARHQIASVCLRHLRTVCDEIGDATAVLVGNDKVFSDLAVELDFEWVHAPNQPLGRKWNEGLYHAGVRMEADYIVRFGSDDVIHPSFFDRLPEPGVIACTRHSAIVSPDGDRLVNLFIRYDGGDGVQIVPASVYEPLRFRPCLEDRQRAVDGSITEHLRLTGNHPVFEYRETDPLVIVDFKTATPDQRNTFQSCLAFAASERSDVFEAVASMHGEALAAQVAEVYGKTLVAA